MKAPPFSVIMPVYNDEKFVDAAIRSVLGQTYADFELIVSDDGSTDRSYEIALGHSVGDPRVRVVRRQSKGGPGGNRNFAIGQAKGEWIAFLDSDDVWPVEHLALCADAISRCPEACFFFGDYRRFSDSIADAESSSLEAKGFFDRDAGYVKDVSRSSEGVELFRMNSDLLLKFCCLYYCPISTPCVTLRRETLQANGIRFREDWDINEDFHIWMRMLESGPATAIRSVLFFYRFNPASLTSNRIRYFEGMARSHGEWMNRILPQLDESEKRIYRHKVVDFLHAAAREHSHEGRLLAATSAELRALAVRCHPNDLVALAKTVVRSAWWRARAVFGRRGAA